MSGGKFWVKYEHDRVLMDFRNLSSHERGVLSTIVAEAFSRDGPVKEEPKRLAMLCGCNKVNVERALNSLIDNGLLHQTPDGLTSDFIENTITDREDRVVNARSAARTRWEDDKHGQTETVIDSQNESSVTTRIQPSVRAEKMSSQCKKTVVNQRENSCERNADACTSTSTSTSTKNKSKNLIPLDSYFLSEETVRTLLQEAGIGRPPARSDRRKIAEWVQDGTPAKFALEMIQKTLNRKTGAKPIGSLKYFDKEMAKWQADNPELVNPVNVEVEGETDPPGFAEHKDMPGDERPFGGMTKDEAFALGRLINDGKWKDVPPMPSSVLDELMGMSLIAPEQQGKIRII